MNSRRPRDSLEHNSSSLTPVSSTGVSTFLDSNLRLWGKDFRAAFGDRDCNFKMSRI